jgi:hypothetical protein
VFTHALPSTTSAASQKRGAAVLVILPVIITIIVVLMLTVYGQCFLHKRGLPHEGSAAETGSEVQGDDAPKALGQSVIVSQHGLQSRCDELQGYQFWNPAPASGSHGDTSYCHGKEDECEHTEM